MKQKAFTLIELLVVIAIIGVIASIVLVNLRGAREKAELAKALQFHQSINHSLGAYAVGVWSFDDSIADGSAADISGYNNHCYIVGSPVEEPEGIFRKAIRFDSNTSGYLDCKKRGSLEMGTSDWTITAWVKTDVTTEHRSIVRKGAGATNVEGYWFTYYANDDDLRFFIGNGITRLNATSNSNLNINDNTWHFVAVSAIRSSNANFYLDGKDVGSFDISSFDGQDITHSIELTISDHVNASYRWDGLIDEVRIYREALIAGEIQKQYAEGVKRYRLAEK